MSCIICGEDNSWGGSFCPHCEGIEQGLWGYSEPTEEDYCAADGHVCNWADDKGFHCYCGKRSEPGNTEETMEAKS